MPSYYKIVDITNDHAFEELGADGTWHLQDGTDRADTRFPTAEDAWRAHFQFWEAAVRRMIWIQKYDDEP